MLFFFLSLILLFFDTRTDPQVQSLRRKQEQLRKLALEAREKGILIFFMIIHDHSYYL
jgi:hypothetical protein